MRIKSSKGAAAVLLFAALACGVAIADDETTKVLKLESGGNVAMESITNLPLACAVSHVVEGHEPSLLPDGKSFELVWHDEFDGDRLDESKWSYRTNFWGRRAHWFAAPEDGCVEVFGGKLHLKLKKLENGQFVSPQLQTGELMWDIPHVPEFILLTTETKWYRNNRMTGKAVPELEAAARAGDDFVVDYVRVYDIVK